MSWNVNLSIVPIVVFQLGVGGFAFRVDGGVVGRAFAFLARVFLFGGLFFGFKLLLIFVHGFVGFDGGLMDGVLPSLPVTSLKVCMVWPFSLPLAP